MDESGSVEYTVQLDMPRCTVLPQPPLPPATPVPGGRPTQGSQLPRKGHIMTARTHSEAERMARVPGITFRDGTAGRRARIAGSPALDVVEVIKHYLAFDRDWNMLRQRFDW